MANSYFLNFGAFAPDSQEFDTPQLDDAKNALPLWGGKRPLRQRQNLSFQSTSTAVTGSHSHLLLSEEQFQYERTDADTTPGSYVALPDQTTSLFSMLDEVTASDATKIAIGGAPNASQCTLRLSDAVAPGSTANHVISMRYRVQNSLTVAAAAVTSITRSGTTATVTTTAPHGLSSNDWVAIIGAVQAAYNITAQITVTGASTFTYIVAGAPTTPATGTITWQKQWAILADLREGSNTRATITATGVGDNDYTAASHNLTVGEAGAIVDPTALSLRLTSTVMGSAQTLYPSADTSNPGVWLTEAGSSSGLYARVNEVSPDDDTSYIVSPAAAIAGSAALYTLTLPASGGDPFLSTSHVLSYRYKALNSGVRLVVRLMQGSTTISTATVSNAATSYTTGTLTLSAGEANSITDYTALSVRFEADYPADTTSTVAQHSQPSADGTGGLSWKTTGGIYTNLYAQVDETSPDDSDYIFLDPGDMPPSDSTQIFTLASVSDPKTTSNHVIKVRAKSSSGGNSLQVKLLSNGTVVKTIDYGAGSGDGPLTSSFQTFSHTLSASESALITSLGSYSQLSFQIIGYGSNGGQGVYISYISVDVPQQRRVRVTSASLALPSAARAEVTWFQFQLPDPDNTFESDRVKLYAGTQDKLWTVTSSAWSDVSKGGGYAAGTSTPHSWSFASWGGDLLATNYVDPVQIFASGGSAFADLITSTNKPKSRHITSINQHVVLADIDNSAGSPTFTGYSDMVCWSGADDATDFDPSTTTGSDYQRLRDIPGQIMAVVGGADYGYIFKRNSIYKMSYVGTPFTFTFQNVALGIGCATPRSIVVVEGDIYFWSGAGFYKLPGDGTVLQAQKVSRIGVDTVDKMLRDTDFETRAVARPQDADQRIMDSVVVGAFDRNSGLIFWSYRGKTDSVYQNNNLLVYNPESEEWGYCADSALLLSDLCGVNNPVNDETQVMSGIIGFDFGAKFIADQGFVGSNYLKFNRNTTYAMTLKSKTISTQAIAGSNAKDKNINILAVRPVFRGLPTSTNPLITVDVLGSDDPLLQSAYTHTVTATQANANRDGWYPMSKVNGEFFTFTLNVPALVTQTIKDFRGIECMYEMAGDSG